MSDSPRLCRHCDAPNLAGRFILHQTIVTLLAENRGILLLCARYPVSLIHRTAHPRGEIHLRCVRDGYNESLYVQKPPVSCACNPEGAVPCATTHMSCEKICPAILERSARLTGLTGLTGLAGGGEGRESMFAARFR